MTIPQPITKLDAAKLFRLPQATVDGGYVLKVDPKNEDGFTFVGRDETINLDGDDFITMSRAELEHLIQRKPAELLPGVPALSSTERMAVGQTIQIKNEARRISNGNRKAYLRALRRISREHIREIEGKIKETEGNLDHTRDRLNALERQRAMYLGVVEWLKSPLILERPDGSAIHKVKQAHRDGDWVIIDADETTANTIPGDEYTEAFGDLQSFVVEHDWAKALDGADITGTGHGEARVGAEVAAFEFVINRRRVIAVMIENEASETRMVITCQLDQGWALLYPFRMTDLFVPVPIEANTQAKLELAHVTQPLANLLARNIRAVCTMLEAEVAQTEVIRVDAKLNRAREKRGKLPLTDYHVVSLVRRERVLPRIRSELDPDRDITRKRMHFRRGHWRHYKNHRTWIKWMLVGDPDLGFVDKHYKL